MASARPIIIKKKIVKHGGHHGGAWKVAYADFVTALMAFFLVMWILGLSEATRKGIAGYFKEPGVFSFTTGKAVPIKIDDTAEVSQHAGDGSGETGKGGKAELVKTSCKGEGGPSKGESNRMANLQQQIEKRLRELARQRPQLAKILSSIDMQVTEQGLRIELSETKDIAYFEVGRAEPSSAAREVISVIGPALGEIGNHIVIEGHTDTRSYPKGATYTNWELSADRANVARKLLLDNGMAKEQIASVTGYADVRLRKADDPFAISNRRVSIVVEYDPPEQKGPARPIPVPDGILEVAPGAAAPAPPAARPAH